MGVLDPHIRAALVAEGIALGTTLENRIALRLHHWGLLDGCTQQYPCGKYRLDFAWPTLLIALEADGPHHWQPANAVNDVARDCWLRSEGWLVLRVDDSSGTLDEQLVRVSRVLRAEAECGAA